MKRHKINFLRTSDRSQKITQRGSKISDPSQKIIQSGSKMISSIWKGNHTKLIDSEPGLMDVGAEGSSPESCVPEPKGDWLNILKLYDAWKKDPELEFATFIPILHHDYEAYKELADFAIQDFNMLHETKFEVGGLLQVSMERSCDLNIFIMFFARDPTPPCTDFTFRSKLLVVYPTGSKHVKFCTHTFPSAQRRKPTRWPSGPRQEEITIKPSSRKGRRLIIEPPYYVDDDDESKILSPEELLKQQLTDKYLATTSWPKPDLNSLWKLDPEHIILKAHPKYEAYKELADLAIAEYNKCHDETKFEVIGVQQWSMSGSCPSALSFYIDFTAKEELQGRSAVVVTFECRVLVLRRTGEKEVEFCNKLEE